MVRSCVELCLTCSVICSRTHSLRHCLAYALVMEVTKYSPWLLEERLKLCKEVKKHVPECKILFLVDENADAELANSVKQVKKDGLIDNFIYASVSPTYLAAILDTL